MSEHSPTPWRIDDDCGIKIVAANEIDVLLLPAWILNAMDAVMLDEADAQHIVKCVNLHDELLSLVGDFVGVCEFARDNGPEYDMDQSDDMKDAMKRGRALLAKAKGEA